MNNNIRKLIDDNWEDIKSLIIEKAEAEQKPKSIWDLKKEDGEQYYVLRTTGDINIDNFSSRLDEYIREAGNVFLTREEAEFEIERRKIEVIMRKYSRPFKNCNPVDPDDANYCIEHNINNNALKIGSYRSVNLGVLYFESEEIAWKVINEIGEDRLIKYWFGVTE